MRKKGKKQTQRARKKTAQQQQVIYQDSNPTSTRITKQKGKKTEAEEPEVDLEGFSRGLRLKGQGSRKKDKKRRAEKKTGEQVKQTEADDGRLVRPDP
jgi:hypothetical protein